MPSVLAAPLVGVGEFGLGSTLAFRAAQLTQIGGFAALEEFLADDYQLARRIVGLGYRVVLSRLVVETFLGDNDWTGVWKHQVRWARTIRVSRSGGYAGLPVTHAGLWGLAALAAGQWQPALALIGLRIAAGCLAGYGVIRSPLALALPLIPLWDLWAFAVWAAGLRGKTVEWRGKRLVLSADGRIRESRYFDAGTIQR
jgi:ceramide glucosyltransferase